MPDKLKIDYDVLNDAKKDLENLAGSIGPLLDHSLFSQLGQGDGYTVLGDAGLAEALSDFYNNAQSTMSRADKGLKELAGAFGSVGEAFMSFDSGLAQGMGITGNNLALQNYFHDKDLWDYKQAHLKDCVPGPDGTMPDFCSATNPGDQPPLHQQIDTSRGSVVTDLTLDANHHVIKEVSTVTYDGKTYTSTTNYSSDGLNYTTDTSYPDGSTVHSVTSLHSDGSGTMTVTGSDGDHTEYTRGPKDGSGKQPDWQPVDGDDGPNGSGSGSGSHNGGDRPPPHPPGGTNPHIA